jgi:hypothetical protein
VEATHPKLAVLKQQYQHLLSELHEQVQQINALHHALQSVTTHASLTVQSHMRRQPAPPSSYYWQTFQAYWQSFALFAEKLAAVAQQLAQPFTVPNHLVTGPPVDAAGQWEDGIDDLEDMLETLKLRKHQRKSLLLMVELLDSTERLSVLHIPDVRRQRRNRRRRSPGRGYRFSTVLRTMQREVQTIRQEIQRTLAAYDVHPVTLAIGQYPPPETTRIIARRDASTHDDIVIAEVVTTGYTWQTGLLRKADVVVESCTRSMN